VCHTVITEFVFCLLLHYVHITYSVNFLPLHFYVAVRWEQMYSELNGASICHQYINNIFFLVEMSVDVIIIIILKSCVDYLCRLEQAWTQVLQPWGATVETNCPALTCLSAMSWLFISGQIGPSMLKASTSNMKQVSRQLSF
jgi:hypothetical protein